MRRITDRIKMLEDKKNKLDLEILKLEGELSHADSTSLDGQLKKEQIQDNLKQKRIDTLCLSVEINALDYALDCFLDKNKTKGVYKMYQATAFIIDNFIFTRKENHKTVNVYLDSLENEIYCFSISENSTYDEFKNHCMAKVQEIKSEI